MKILKNILQNWLAIAAVILTLPLVTIPFSPLRAGDALKVEEPLVRVTIPGRPAAGYMTVKNTGAEPDAIVSASSPLAKRIGLHKHSMDGGIMRMRQVEKVEVPAAGEVAFSSGGYHLMIFGLDPSIAAGGELAVTLKFLSGASLDVTFPVGKAGAGGGAAHQHRKH